MDSQYTNCNCAAAGYRVQRLGELGSVEVTVLCTNPWCPTIPTCPFGHSGPFKAAGIGRWPEAICRCNTIWPPDRDE